MYYRVVVLSEDAVFARMLELELAGLRISVLSTNRMNSEDHADVLILDLDSSAAPPAEQYRRMIGFSRRSAMTAPDARSCSMILRRPFRMSLLRREVLAQLEQGSGSLSDFIPVISPEKRQITLRKEEALLICDGQTVALTPHEMTVMELLLAHRGTAVSREILAKAMGGAEEGNETDVYICYLRRKTDGLPGGRLIRTVRGKGYQIL